MPTEDAKENAHCLRKLPVTKVDIPSIEVSQRVLGVKRNCCLIVCHRVLLLTHKLMNHTTICQEFCCSIDLQHNRRRIWHLGIAWISNFMSVKWRWWNPLMGTGAAIVQVHTTQLEQISSERTWKRLLSCQCFIEWLHKTKNLRALLKFFPRSRHGGHLPLNLLNERRY